MADDWPAVRAEAARAHNERTAELPLGTPLLVDFLEEGLALLGRSVKSSKLIASDRARRGPSVVGYGGSKSQPPSGDRDWRFGVERAYAMKLTFLGTRSEIEICTRRHRRHSSLLVQYNDARVMIDCGTDWLGRLRMIAPTAVVLTHAHPDHASGLAEGARARSTRPARPWPCCGAIPFPIDARCRCASPW